LARTDDASAASALIGRATVQIIESYDAAKAQALFATLKRHGTYQTPTLTVLRALGSLADPKFTADPRRKYMASYLTRGWLIENRPQERRPTAETLAGQRATYEHSLRLGQSLAAARGPDPAGPGHHQPVLLPRVQPAR